jgi:YesN/AraC family two-component response regulator
MLEKNDILLIDKFAFHKTSYSSMDGNERVLIEFHEDVFDIINDKNVVNKIKMLFRTSNKISLSGAPQFNCIHTIIMDLVSNFKSQSPNGLILAKLNLVELCLHLADIGDNSKIVRSQEVPHTKKSENSVVEIIKYINENYNTKISLDTLVERFYANKYYLCHVFKEETGLSIIDFVNSKRLAEAEKLLRYSSDSITEICYKVGFSSINYFLKLFKSAYNLTPKKFRSDVRKTS